MTATPETPTEAAAPISRHHLTVTFGALNRILADNFGNRMTPALKLGIAFELELTLTNAGLIQVDGDKSRPALETGAGL